MATNIVWDAATARLVADVDARWRTMVTVAFAGAERASVVVSEISPTQIDRPTWLSCPGPPSGNLASGTSATIYEQVIPSVLAIKPLNSGGVACGPPGTATMDYGAPNVTDAQTVVGDLVSMAYEFIMPSGDTIYVIIVIRNEGGAGNTALDCASQTAAVAARLHLNLAAPPRRPARAGTPSNP